MKNKILIISFFAFLSLGISQLVFSQSPPPPNDGEDPTSSGHNTPVGEGAPIDGGLGILLALGAAYGGKKLYDLKRKKTQKTPT